MRSVTESLPAQLFLLACDPEKEKVTGRDSLGYVVRAAALAELEIQDCLRDDGGKARARDRRTGDAFLDGVLRGIAAQPRPRRWKTLVAKERRQTLDALESALESAGLISVERRTLRPRRVRARDRELPQRLRAQAAGILCGDVPVSQVEPRQAALTAMAALGKLSPLVTWRDRHQHRHRLKELTAAAGPAGPALKKALDARNAAVASSGGGGG
ncbi:GOLPH3/VPS74 family protein [Streptomyces iconiensis]|uniref:GPP34 family phosphoprotein n=1 Tax=Streptomyces iconiensis TaxID=1384038 RepID=A0ABT7A492_9ACTN|nr:GPP34 family phosphoprotein [Streptomyces iconiensis]MDJ1136139.1 GPP34 family phosphoprotein [Streptomyces iconiensis]